MTVLLPLDGSPRGRETEADPKQPGVALWRRGETDKDGTTWAIARQAVNNRQQWREDVRALCASWREEI